MHSTQSYVLLPVFAGTLFGIIFKLAGGPACGAFLVAAAGTAPVALISAPAWLVKQTTTPSRIQRLLRSFFLFIERTRPHDHFPAEELPAFRWWLSHPGWDWPENFEELAPFIDTDTFDWQNPNEWSEPLRRAQEQLARQKATAQIPPLVIGSQANDFSASLQAARLPPTAKMTSLLAAVIHNNIREMEKLLPTEEINRAYAGNGNTPLHIAAWNGYTEIAKLLLAQPGINKEAKNLAGKTPLDLAKEQNHIEIADLLKK